MANIDLLVVFHYKWYDIFFKCDFALVFQLVLAVFMRPESASSSVFTLQCVH